MEKWRFLDTGKNNAVFNMALDEAIFNIHIEGLTPPTFRVFDWQYPALSLGYNQKLEGINFKKGKEMGIDFVRRSTGGGAILHTDELAYSVVISCKNFSAQESYELFNTGLIESFKFLGIKTELSRLSQIKIETICFMSTCLADLTSQGKKLVGSAQLRRRNSILQHGSIMISYNLPMVFSTFTFPSEKAKEQALIQFQKSTTSLLEIKKEVTREEIKKALFEGFQKALGIQFFKDKLIPEEISECQRLIGKYRDINRRS